LQAASCHVLAPWSKDIRRLYTWPETPSTPAWPDEYRMARHPAHREQIHRVPQGTLYNVILDWSLMLRHDLHTPGKLKRTKVLMLVVAMPLESVSAGNLYPAQNSRCREVLT